MDTVLPIPYPPYINILYLRVIKRFSNIQGVTNRFGQNMKGLYDCVFSYATLALFIIDSKNILFSLASYIVAWLKTV